LFYLFIVFYFLFIFYLFSAKLFLSKTIHLFRLKTGPCYGSWIKQATLFLERATSTAMDQDQVVGSILGHEPRRFPGSDQDSISWATLPILYFFKNWLIVSFF